MNIEIRLHYAPQRRHQTAAWLIPGSRSGDWLDEITRWPVSARKLRLIVVPDPSAHHQARGVVVVGDVEEVSPSAICQAYGVIGQRLYVPVHTELSPAVSAAEISALLHPDYLYVWHPVSGLIAASGDQQHRVVDLLDIQPAQANRWMDAEPGTAPMTRLQSLTGPDPPPIQLILSEGQDDIGSESDQLDQLEPSPDEPNQSFFGKAAEAGKGTFAKALLGLTNLAPRTSQTPTWVNQIENWANNQLNSISQGMFGQRNRQLHRLLRMLQNDPDQGLKFALPLSGDGSHRGIAPPGSRLGARDVDFNLSRLGGGGAADFWDVPYEMQVQLQRQYHQLAEREMRLGRYRRAAYIYAQLLGDLNTAAQALVTGRHWREAAVLYREKLKRPLDAARCLHQGGLWAEAIALYEEYGEYEIAGDLYVELEQVGAAKEAYKHAVSAAKSNLDYVDAARICEKKLHDQELAIATLDQGWPTSKQAMNCLSELFRLLGDAGRHKDTAERMESIRKNMRQVPNHHFAQVAELFAKTARKYPDRDTRSKAAVATRAIVSFGLKERPKKADATRLTAALEKLNPHDRLLGRDARRYVQQQSQWLEKKDQPLVLRNLKAKLVKHDVLSLPDGVHWMNAISAGDHFYAAGLRNNLLQVIRGDWTGELQHPYAKPQSIKPAVQQNPIMMAYDPRANILAVHFIGGSPLKKRNFFMEVERFPQRTMVDTRPAISTATLAMVYSGGWFWSLCQKDMQIELYACDGTHTLVTSKSTTFELTDYLHADGIHFDVRDRRAYVACGTKMKVFARGDEVMDRVFDEPIASLALSAPASLRRTAIGFRNGGSVIWEGLPSHIEYRLPLELDSPNLLFTRAGFVIAADDHQIMAFSTRDAQLDFVASCANPFEGYQRPMALLRTADANRFAMLTDNSIFIFSVS